MSSPSGLFYAYAKHSTTDWAWRYMITFANRATADEWWRAVTGSVASGYNRFSGVQRITHQFYVHNPDVDNGNIMQTINDERCARKFLGRVFFTLLNDRDGRIVDIAPVLNYTDHISGQGYFIRSSLQPDLYWSYNGRLVASRTHRTKFNVELAEGKKGQVIIGTDLITISIFDPKIFLRFEPGQQISAAPGQPILFSQLDGGIRVGESDSLVYDEMGAGDRWELV